MKVAIASTGKDVNSRVSLVAGRAPYYLIFDNKKLVKVVENPFRVGGGGAGFGVAKMLEKEGVDMIVSGKFGPNIVSYLNSKNIKEKVVTDKTVKEALEEIA